MVVCEFKEPGDRGAICGSDADVVLTNSGLYLCFAHRAGVKPQMLCTAKINDVMICNSPATHCQAVRAPRCPIHWPSYPLMAPLDDLGPDAAVHHPSHYGGDTTYEAIKVIEAWGLNFSLGSVLKYICRNGKKTNADQIEDLKKARWYLAREIDRLEAGRQ